MRHCWLVGLLALAVIVAGCAEEKTKTTSAPTIDTTDKGSSATSPDPQKTGEPPKSPASPPPPAPAPAPSGGSGAYFATVPGYSGTSGFVQFEMTGLYIEGQEVKHGIVFISDAGGFAGDNWIYVRCLDTIPGRPVGGCKIKAEAQGVAVENSYSGTTHFRRDRKYRFRVEWDSGRVRMFLDGAEYTTLGLPRAVAITGLHVHIGETPRSAPDPPYAGAVVSNVQIVGR